MNRLLTFLLVGCVRQGVNVPVIDVQEGKPLPPIEALALDPEPPLPEDFFVEISAIRGDPYGAAILPDRSLRLQLPGYQGCSGTVSIEVARRVLGIVDSIKFMDLHTEYPQVVSGNVPAWKITVHARGRKNTVVHYDGEHSLIVRGVTKGVPDIGTRIDLAKLEDALKAAIGWEDLSRVSSLDLQQRTLAAWHLENVLDDGLWVVRSRCGGMGPTTALQLTISSNGTVSQIAPIPGLIDDCADTWLHEISFDPACNATTALFTLDSEGLHAVAHHLAPAE